VYRDVNGKREQLEIDLDDPVEANDIVEFRQRRL
jgi:hypothetical protein